MFARGSRSSRRTRRRRSLLGKVVVALSTVTCLVALATVFPLAGVYRRQLVDVRRERLDLVTRLLVQQSLADCQTDEGDLLEAVERNARALAGELGGAEVRVVDHRGIAISHALVSRMGGRLEIAAAEGRGATFRIVLPRA